VGKHRVSKIGGTQLMGWSTARLHTRKTSGAEDRTIPDSSKKDQGCDLE